MSAEIDWVAALAEIERKIAKLQITAEGIKEMITTGGGSISSNASVSSSPSAERITNTQQIPSDAFLGMAIHDAIKKYLEMVRSDRTVRQILEALEQGGLRHASTKSIYTSLWRRRTPNGDFAQPTENTWGLAEWYRHSPILKRQSKSPKSTTTQTPSAPPTGSSKPPAIRKRGGMTHVDHCEVFLRESNKPLHIKVLLSKLAEKDIFTKTDNLSTPLRKDPHNRFENLGRNTWALKEWPESMKAPYRKGKE